MPIFSPISPFFRQWNSEKKMGKLPSTVSVLLLSGQSDEVIPPTHMKGLWKAANPKVEHPCLERYGRFVEFEGGCHSEYTPSFLCTCWLIIVKTILGINPAIGKL